jgi:hypothetical protein
MGVILKKLTIFYLIYLQNNTHNGTNFICLGSLGVYSPCDIDVKLTGDVYAVFFTILWKTYFFFCFPTPPF